MEPERKRNKFEQPSPANEIQFLDLNEDCIFAIFDRLTLYDLCSMSFTCKRLQALAFNQFQRKYSDEEVLFVETKTTYDGNMSINSDRNEKHLTYFSKLIRNVVLYGKTIKQLLDFVKAECCPKLDSLDINITGPMRSADGAIIKDQLENLDKLIVGIMDDKTDFHNVWFKHCKKLKHLSVTIFHGQNIDWLMQHYPTLQSLNIEFFMMLPKYFERFVIFFGQFTRNNSQIKDFSCNMVNSIFDYDSSIPILHINTTNMVKIILQNAVEIKRLNITTNYEALNDSFYAILDDLKAYCQQSPIEMLEFQLSEPFPDPNALHVLRMLRDLNRIHQIHGLSIVIEDIEATLNGEIIPIVMKFENLKKITVQIRNRAFESTVTNFMKQLSEKMIHLEELELHMNCCGNDFILKNHLMPFVCGSVKMERLKINVGYIDIAFDKRDSLIMSAARSRLPKSCSMNIQIIRYSRRCHRARIHQQINIPCDVNNIILRKLE